MHKTTKVMGLTGGFSSASTLGEVEEEGVRQLSFGNGKIDAIISCTADSSWV